jgi:lysine 2,3-aminomutase
MPTGDLPGNTTFTVDELSQRFRAAHFPDCSLAQWNDWRWQMRNRFRSTEEFERILSLSKDEREALEQSQRFSSAITPYYASLIPPDAPDDPLRRTIVPNLAEFAISHGDSQDPLAEDAHSPVPGIVHRYPHRVLFLVTDHCPVYCRYCTRSRLVGGKANFELTRRQWQRGIDYIASTPAVHDVLISGGDPLIMSDDRLEWLLSRLSKIPHLDYIRIGSKVPVALPMRISPSFCDMLKRYQPLFMSIHITHPRELSPEAGQACMRLADAGLPLGSQTVLLKGINDDAETLRKLMRGLLRIRVRPYYLLQCDPITGSGHFRTSLEQGKSLIRELRGHLSGYAIPHYIVDLPGGGGKIPLVPDYLTGHDGKDWIATNFQGIPGFRYPDPEASADKEKGFPMSTESMASEG